MDFKQLKSLVEVVECRSFTKAAERLYISQPTVSAHIRQLEEELQSRLVIRTTKSIEITPRGLEAYDCARSILELRENLLRRWADDGEQMIQLGASTIPSAYILPEILPAYGREHPKVYFVIHQSDSQGVVQGLLNGSFDLGMTGMNSGEEELAFEPFYRDRMVLITPVNRHFLELMERKDPISALLKEPVILREQGSGSRKSAEDFLASAGLREEDLKVAARVNDQESIKNLVAGGLGVSIISERAARNFIREKRLLAAALPGKAAGRNLYLVYRKNYILKKYVRQFIRFTGQFYGVEAGQ